MCTWWVDSVGQFDVDELCHVAVAGGELSLSQHTCHAYTYTLTWHKWLDCLGGLCYLCDTGVTAGCLVACAELGHVP